MVHASLTADVASLRAEVAFLHKSYSDHMDEMCWNLVDSMSNLMQETLAPFRALLRPQATGNTGPVGECTVLTPVRLARPTNALPFPPSASTSVRYHDHLPASGPSCASCPAGTSHIGFAADGGCHWPTSNPSHCTAWTVAHFPTVLAVRLGAAVRHCHHRDCHPRPRTCSTVGRRHRLNPPPCSGGRGPELCGPYQVLHCWEAANRDLHPNSPSLARRREQDHMGGGVERHRAALAGRGASAPPGCGAQGLAEQLVQQGRVSQIQRHVPPAEGHCGGVLERVSSSVTPLLTRSPFSPAFQVPRQRSRLVQGLRGHYGVWSHAALQNDRHSTEAISQRWGTPLPPRECASGAPAQDPGEWS